MIQPMFCFQCKVAATAEEVEEEDLELREPESKKRKTDCEFLQLLLLLSDFISFLSF